MVAVWSYWSKPAHYVTSVPWCTPLASLLSWVLSVRCAQNFFKRTVLVTDDAGARMLIDGLGLNFTQVSLELNNIADFHQNWWALGKIIAYGIQKEPFIHIDNDVFFWKDLPLELRNAKLIVQSPENVSLQDSVYHHHRLDSLKQDGGWLPEELSWYRTTPYPHKASNCGIFGGNDLEFIQYYSENAIHFIKHPLNKTKWVTSPYDNVLIEQYYLNACVAYHNLNVNSKYSGIEINYLFPPPMNPFLREISELVGYTHLIGFAKGNRYIASLLESRVKASYPEEYQRCQNYVQAT